MPNTARLREVIRQRRKDRGWTQEELATKAGLQRITINKLENGKTKVLQLEVLQAVAEALETTASELLAAAGM